MKRILSIALCLSLCLSACAPGAEAALRPDAPGVETAVPAETPASEAGIAAPDGVLRMLKTYAEDNGAEPTVTFNSGVWLEGIADGLAVSALSPPAVIALHGGELYMYRNYPVNLSVPAGQYARKPGLMEQTRIEVYNADGKRDRVILLEGLDNLLVTVLENGLTVDADGINLLLVTMAYTPDGKPLFGSSAILLYRFDHHGRLLEALPLEQAPVRLMRADGALYAVMRSQYTAQRAHPTEAEALIDAFRTEEYLTICRYDAETGRFTPVPRGGAQEKALRGALPCPDGRLLCVDITVREDTNAPAMEVSLFDPATGVTEARSYVYINHRDLHTAVMGYDPAADTLYFVQGDALLAWRLGTAAPVTQLLRSLELADCAELLSLGGKLLMPRQDARIDCLSDLVFPPAEPLTAENAGQIAYGTKPAAAETDQLSILVSVAEKEDFELFSNSYSPLRDMDGYTASQHLYNIELSPDYYGKTLSGLSDNTQSYHLALAEKLAAGDDDFDLFFLGGTQYAPNLVILNGIIADGLLQPLDELGLAPLYDDMLPGIQELCSANGRILLAPVQLDFHTLSVCHRVYRDLGYAVEDMPRTTDELAAFFQANLAAVEAMDYSMYFGAGDSLLNAVSAQYAVVYNENPESAPAAWDAFLRFLNESEKYWNRSDSYNYVNRNLPLFHIRERGLVVGGRIIPDVPGGYYASDYYMRMPVPQLVENTKHPLASSLFIGVNPNSKNLALVTEFLRVYLSKQYHDYRAAQADASGWGFRALSAVFYDLPRLNPAEFPTFPIYKTLLQNATRGYPGMLTYRDQEAYLKGWLTGESWRERFDQELAYYRNE